MIELYKGKSECSGCGVCALSCSKKAITMKENLEGFFYPVIDEKKCIGCGRCIKQCPHGKIELHKPTNCYAGSNVNNEQKKYSTSAGIFSAVATAFLEMGGLVCGATMTIKNGHAEVKHILISSINDLRKLQGSKYVKSDMTEVIPQIGDALKNKNQVLFSGTPCQVSAIKSIYKEFSDKIYTIDIICHGVPSLKFFNDYLGYLQESQKRRIVDFCFRDKDFGWGHKGSVTFEGNMKHKTVLSPDNSSYYNFFYECEVLRDSCYKCPYACGTRIGDLTIGDYWGVQKFNPELLIENGGVFVKREGVSCILENTNLGTELLEIAKKQLEIRKIDIVNVIAINTQLKTPAKCTGKREKILRAYHKGGYARVEKLYRCWLWKKKRLCFIKKLIPSKIKSMKRLFINR